MTQMRKTLTLYIKKRKTLNEGEINDKKQREYTRNKTILFYGFIEFIEFGNI